MSEEFGHRVGDGLLGPRWAGRRGRSLQLDDDPAVFVNHPCRDFRATDINADGQRHWPVSPRSGAALVSPWSGAALVSPWSGAAVASGAALAPGAALVSGAALASGAGLVSPGSDAALGGGEDLARSA